MLRREREVNSINSPREHKEHLHPLISLISFLPSSGYQNIFDNPKFKLATREICNCALFDLKRRFMEGSVSVKMFAADRGSFQPSFCTPPSRNGDSLSGQPAKQTGISRPALIHQAPGSSATSQRQPFLLTNLLPPGITQTRPEDISSSSAGEKESHIHGFNNVHLLRSRPNLEEPSFLGLNSLWGRLRCEAGHLLLSRNWSQIYREGQEGGG